MCSWLRRFRWSQSKERVLNRPHFELPESENKADRKVEEDTDEQAAGFGGTVKPDSPKHGQSATCRQQFLRSFCAVGVGKCPSLSEWRRERDSNPRYRFWPV